MQVLTKKNKIKKKSSNKSKDFVDLRSLHDFFFLSYWLLVVCRYRAHTYSSRILSTIKIITIYKINDIYTKPYNAAYNGDYTIRILMVAPWFRKRILLRRISRLWSRYIIRETTTRAPRKWSTSHIMGFFFARSLNHLQPWSTISSKNQHTVDNTTTLYKAKGREAVERNLNLISSSVDSAKKNTLHSLYYLHVKY